MAAWSSALDFGAHPAVGYYYEGHTVGVKVVVVELVASARLFKSHIIIVVGNTNVGGTKVKLKCQCDVLHSNKEQSVFSL